MLILCMYWLPKMTINAADDDKDCEQPGGSKTPIEDTVNPTVADEVHEHNDIGKHVLNIHIFV